MDTLFRLVSLQSSSSDQHHHHHQQSNSSFNSTTTSRSPSKHQNHNNNYNYQQQQYSYNSDSSYYPQQQQQQAYSSSYQYYYPHNSSSSSPQEEEDPAEECCTNPHPTTTTTTTTTLYMDEDHFSSSSSSQAHHFLTTPPSSSNPNPHPSSLVFDPPPTDLSAGGARWGTDLLLDCARAVSARDTPRVQQLMWMMNELASPYGDKEQKLASYFLQALFARLTSSGPRTLRTLSSASDRTASFDSTRRTALRFQDLSPWSSFGHVAANGAILESFLLDSAGAPQRLHILDLSNTFCTQWPTLLEALATRSADDTPHLTITTVVSSPAASSAVQRVMKEIGARMEKFARLMGVPFKFHIVHHAGDLSTLDLDQLGCSDDGDAAALAINCVNSLHGVSPVGRRRDGFISALRRLRPRIVTVVEEEADLDVGGDGGDDEEGFLKGFRESLRFFSAYFDSLEESFPKTSNERLALERAAGRAVVDLVACSAAESVERRETAAGWSRRLRSAGLTPANFSDDVADDVRALLRRYREGWSMTAAAGDETAAAAGIFLAWKEQPVVWASAWRM